MHFLSSDSVSLAAWVSNLPLKCNVGHKLAFWHSAQMFVRGKDSRVTFIFIIACNCVLQNVIRSSMIGSNVVVVLLLFQFKVPPISNVCDC